MTSVARLLDSQEPLDLTETLAERPAESRSLSETVQFVLPRRALAAINPISIIAEARRDGVNHLRIVVKDGRASPEETHLTCGFTMAVRVVRAIERAEAVATKNSNGPLAMDLAAAGSSAVAALSGRIRR